MGVKHLLLTPETGISLRAYLVLSLFRSKTLSIWQKFPRIGRRKPYIHLKVIVSKASSLYTRQYSSENTPCHSWLTCFPVVMVKVRGKMRQYCVMKLSYTSNQCCGSGSFYHQAKIEKNLDFYCFVTSV